MKTIPKFCKDCKHHLIHFAEHSCDRMSYKEYNVVTGVEEIYGILRCREERYYDNLCGFIGKYFKPK